MGTICKSSSKLQLYILFDPAGLLLKIYSTDIGIAYTYMLKNAYMRLFIVTLFVIAKA